MAVAVRTFRVDAVVKTPKGTTLEVRRIGNQDQGRGFAPKGTPFALAVPGDIVTGTLRNGVFKPGGKA